VGAAGTGGRGYGRLACRRCRSTGHLRKYFPCKKKMLTTGVGYSGRIALRRDQCDVHAVDLRGQQRKNALPWQRTRTQQWKELLFSTGPVPKMDLREIVWSGIDWIDLAEDRDQWRALVNAIMNLGVP
jgi:hypothetical protein